MRLPIAPGSDPESRAGLDMLITSYIDRMASTVTNWFTNILQADLQVRACVWGGSVCMHACVHVCVVCVCMHACVCVCICMCMHVCMCVYVCTHVCLWVGVHGNVCACTCG